MATTVKCKIILFDDVLHSSLFSLENDHNSQQIISLKDIIEYYVVYILVYVHTKWSETAAAHGAAQYLPSSRGVSSLLTQ